MTVLTALFVAKEVIHKTKELMRISACCLSRKCNGCGPVFISTRLGPVPSEEQQEAFRSLP